MKKRRLLSIVLLISLFASVTPVYADGQMSGNQENESIALSDEEKVSWSLNGVITDVQSPQNVDQEITVSADVSGNTEGLKYKFVWMKDNWSEWGVLKEFSEENNIIWKPGEAGAYWIYVDVKD